MGVLNCPSCGRFDKARKASAVVAQDSRVYESNSSRVTPLGREISRSNTLGTSNSLVTEQLTDFQGRSYPPGSFIMTFSIIGLAINLFCFFSSFDPNYEYTIQYRPGYLFFIFIGLLGFIYGIRKNRNQKIRAEWAAKNNAAVRHNTRVASAWYCSRCGVRFDNQGTF